ncbi:DNA-binding response regulator [Vibrio sp. MACH09]|uniref:response regulator transcription factor n=1 Tax=unclassified Vibrio TaxID=2614977 RepID=UPI001493583A|nr:MULTISPECIES: response regulator transcription factor [unclassified Vibrio]NOI67473.1 response regulator transcription factor [Vibrio sp. 99-8-1]GLO60786.1 DNA-binding response regulator [Vibrio sp. MACH09]
MKVLIVEDDITLAKQLGHSLEQEGWTTENAMDGIDALYRATSESWDAIVLDLGLPKLNGIAVLKGIRDEGITVPIVILSARDTLTQRIEGLNEGADDYLIKPFEMPELIARLQVQIRRQSGTASPVIRAGLLSLDTVSSKISLNGTVLILTALEYKVLSYFIRNKDKVISRTELVEHIYKQDFDRDSNTIEVFIGRLRKKLGSERIKTVRGLGYQLNAE